MLTGLTRQGRLDSEAILSLSKFIMESRAAKGTSETGLRQRLQANTGTAEFARKQLAELSAGSGRHAVPRRDSSGRRHQAHPELYQELDVS
jgi:hypothetical protein